MKETLFERLLPEGVSCRPIFDFLCDINTLSGYLIFGLIYTLLNYLIFRLLAQSKFGRFIIAFSFVMLFPLLSFIFYRNAILFFIH